MSNPGEFVWRTHLTLIPHNCVQLHKCYNHFVELYVNQKSSYQNCKLSRQVISQRV